jgi:class 3 adenylate cyclase
MAQLRAAERDKLPDRAFAYIDSRGRRRLPIADASHVRNALARFNQVEFEDAEARERARLRLLRAAKRFRIVPVGFISSQLRAERVIGASQSAAHVDLPSGFVTMLMTDIEGSTALVDLLGDDYGGLLADVRDIQREAAERCGSIVVETRADEFFAVSDCPRSALETAIDLQRQLRSRRWRTDRGVRVRVGIHAGYPTLHDGNYIGMAVHTTARICAAAHGGQIVVSGDTKTALTGMIPDGVRFKRLGSHHLRGIPDEQLLFEVASAGLTGRFPPPRT